MRFRLELVHVPVSDVDRALAFYVEKAGFVLDHDIEPRPGMRIVQLTPEGSDCSIVIGLSRMAPGSVQGLQLVVADLAAARAELTERGLAVSDPTELGPPGTDGSKFMFFADPDGNGWAVQEIRARGSVAR